jgi:hypothetical protein
MRAPVMRVLGDHDRARHVDPLALDQQAHLPALPHVDEIVRRPAIAVIAAGVPAWSRYRV